jgi:hypothetical protein
MKEIEQKISIFVENQFPQFVREEAPLLIEFAKEYYKWAEQSNNYIYHSRNLLNYKDIDKTVDEFLLYFKEKYLLGTTLNTEKTATEVKNSLDIYRSKGTPRSIDLFFKNNFNVSDSVLYYPKVDIIKASDGEYVIPNYLEITQSERTKNFFGKQIVGSASGATAFVEGVSRKSLSGKYIDILYLSNVKGNFLFEELLTENGDLKDSPKVVGSLTTVDISEGGRDFEKGDIVNIIATGKGKGGKARVEEVAIATGKVTFTLVDGGSGYTINTNPIVASKMLGISDVNVSNVFLSGFLVDETVTQPLANIVFQNANTRFSLASQVDLANSTANVAVGRVVGTSQPLITGTASANSSSNTVIGSNTNFSVSLQVGDYVKFQACTTSFVVANVVSNTEIRLSSAGPNVNSNTLVVANSHMLISVMSGNVAAADRIAGTSATMSFTNRTATGIVIGSNGSAVGLISVSNVFTGNSYAYLVGNTSGTTANVITVGTGSGADFNIGSISDTEVISLGEDLIGGTNQGTVPYLSLNLNAADYEFPKLPEGNSTFGVINQILTRTSYTIGTISSLKSINPGVGYNFSPFVLLREPKISFYDRRNLHLSISNSSGTFTAGETLLQNFSQPTFTLEITGLSIPFTVGESVTQKINSTANVSGEVLTANSSRVTILTSNSFVVSTVSANLTGNVSANTTSSQVNGNGTTFTTQISAGDFIKFNGNSGIFQVNNVSNNTILFLTTNAVSVTGNNYRTANGVAFGLTSNQMFFVNTATSTAQVSVARGTVINSSSSFINVKRTSFNTSFTPNVQLTGSVSGVTANVISVSQIAGSSLMGNNGIVTSVAGTADGEIQQITVIDSGFGYENDEELTITKSNSVYVATGFANLINQGSGTGYFRSTRGFLNSDKYIHDGDFYQEFAYQIRNGLPLDTYSDVLKQLVHVAGTKLFGGIDKLSNADVTIKTTGIEIDT